MPEAVRDTRVDPSSVASALRGLAGTARRAAASGLNAGTVAALGVALLVGVPVLTVFAQTLAPSHGIWQHLVETVLATYVANTLALLVLVAALTLVAGIASAWFVTMYEFPGRAVLQWALLLPLAMPAYVLAYTYTDFFQFTGPLQTWLRAAMGWRRGDYWFPEIHSVPGAAFILSSVLYPYVYVLARAAFLEQSVCVLEVSRTLGCGPVASFRRVALPLARPAIVAGVGFALMETLADFGAVRYFGVDTFTVGIYRTWFALGSPAAAGQLASVLLGFVFLLLALERLSRGRSRFSQTSTRYRRLPAVRLAGRWAALAWVVCLGPIFFGFLLPGAILVWMVARHGTEIPWSRFVELSLNSFLLAAAGAATTVLVGLLVAYGVRGDRTGLARGAARVATLGYATPGAVIAVGILIVIGQVDAALGRAAQAWFGQSVGLVIGGSVVAIVYGYLIRFFSVAYSPIEAGFAKISPNLEGAARSLGRRPLRVLAEVHLPLMSASILSAGLLVFVDVMKELPATMILRPFNFDTLAIEAFRMATTERLDDAALPSLVIVAAGLLPVILLSRSIARSRPGHR